MVTYLYRCESDHDNLRPGQVGETPPEHVTCDVCQKDAARKWGIPEVSFRGSDFTGAGAKPRQDVRRQ